MWLKARLILGAFAIVLILFGCTPAQVRPTPFPTFTPLGGFQILGVDTAAPGTETPTPQAATPTQSTGPDPTQQPSSTPSPSITDSPPLISMVFTGQIVPARCVQAETDRRGSADYIYENVRDLISNADLAVGTLNAAITDTPPMTGCVETFVLVGSPIQADAMANAGFDLMSIATNHIKNCGLTSCGDDAFYDTLDNLARVGIQAVGAGENSAQAIAPVIVEVSGVRFGFVSLGQIEPLAFAGEETPGIGVLNEENLRSAIAAARKGSDVVILLPHWGPEYTHLPNFSQMNLARIAVEAGADLVVGNHTHYIQAYVQHLGVPIFFGLGNFIFDQTQEPQRQQSLIVRMLFQGPEILSYEIFPVMYDRTGAAHLATQAEAVEILTQIQQINARVQKDFE